MQDALLLPRMGFLLFIDLYISLSSSHSETCHGWYALFNHLKRHASNAGQLAANPDNKDCVIVSELLSSVANASISFLAY